MVDASESGSVVAPKVDVEVTSINLIAIDINDKINLTGLEFTA